MFVSFEYIRDLDYDTKINKFRWEYKIVDTDFEKVGVAFGVGVEIGIEVGIAVVETYRKRNLPVVPNLILAWQYIAKESGDYTIEELIDWSKQYNPHHAEYEDEINKYLLLL